MRGNHPVGMGSWSRIESPVSSREKRMTVSRPWTRCVLLQSPGKGDSARIKSLLAARDWHVVQQSDAYLALAELCIRRRAMISRAAWGLSGRESQALVIAEPDQQPGLVQFIAAIQKYVPGALILKVESDRLVPLEESPGHTTTNSENPLPEPESALIEVPAIKKSSLRLVKPDPELLNSPLPATESSPESYEEEELTPGITPEEIDMLLATPPTRENAP